MTIPCLDKGYVSLVGTHMPLTKLNELSTKLFQQPGKKFLRLSAATFVIKCPLVVQLALSQIDATIVVANLDKIEAYTPNPGELNVADFSTAQQIANNMNRTTEALLINPEAYTRDGCDKNMAQMLLPVNTYTTLVVQSSYNEWRRFADAGHTSSVIKSYADAIGNLLQLEWKV